MLNNSIEVTFYMESNDYINMGEIDKILNKIIMLYPITCHTFNYIVHSYNKKYIYILSNSVFHPYIEEF